MRRTPILGSLLGATLLGACVPSSAPTPKVVVFFAHDSVAIDAPATVLVAGAAKRADADPAALVTVAGYAAAHGNQTADAVLAGRRAQAVATLLEADGVSASRISVVPRPPSNEDPPVAARRVEITVGEP